VANFKITDQETGKSYIIRGAPDQPSAIAEYQRQKSSGAFSKTEPQAEPEEPLTPRNEQRKKVRDQMGGFGGGFNQVVPWQDEIIATMATPLGMVTRHMAGEDKNEGWGESIANAWSEEHQNIEQQNKEYDERHPILSTVQNVVGSMGIAAPARVAGLAPSVAAQLPRVAPRFEATLPQRVAKGMGIGAGLGAAYGSGEGDNLGERIDNGISGGLWGGGAGAGGQLVAEGVGAIATRGVAPLVRTMRDPERQARVTATRAMDQDIADGAQRLPERGLSDPEFQWAQDQGYNVGNIDKGGENVTSAADAIYQRSGSARNRVNDFIATREDQQLPMTERVIDSMLASPGDIARRRANIRAGRLQAGGMYDQAFQHPNATNMWGEGYSQIIGSDIGQQAVKNANKILLDDNALRGANRIKSPFDEEPVFVTDPQTGQRVNSGTSRMRLNPDLERMGVGPNLQYWDYVKQGFDEVIEAERDGIKGLSPRGRRAQELKEGLVNHLDYMTRDPQTGRSLYGEARASAGRYLGEESAASAGGKLYKEMQGNSKTLEAAQLQIARWTADEREEAAQSFLEALKDDMIGKARSTHRDAGNVDLSLNFLKSEKQRRAAEALLGPERLNRLEVHNMIQRVMAYRNKAMRGNSKTWQRSLADEALAPVTGVLGTAMFTGVDPTAMTWGGMLGLLGRRGPKFINDQMKNRIAPHLADEIIGDNPQTYQEVVNTLADDQQLRQYLKLMTHPLRLSAGQYGSE
jgi:hypothetical protein